MSTNRWWALIAGVNGALAVAFGAFGAHGAGSAEAAQWLRTGSNYHLLHTLALLALALADPARSLLRAARTAFLIGIIGFSGSLYALALGAPSWFGAVAPLGGTAFIIGWLLIAATALKRG